MEYKYFQFASPFNQFPRMVTTPADVDSYWSSADGENAGRSWQLFNESLKHFSEISKSTSGFRGQSYSPIVPIDIDNTCTDQLRITLHNINYQIGTLEYVRVYYSGAKGYHIEIPSGYFDMSASENLPERIKRMVTQMDVGADLSLYKQNQLYRMNNSFNVKGERYKVEIPIPEILDGIDLDAIKTLATKPEVESFNMINIYEFDGIAPTPALKHLWESTYCRDITKLKVPGGVKQGLRNNNAYNMSIALKTQGIKPLRAEKIVLDHNKKNKPPVRNLEELKRTVKSAYKSDIYKKFEINPILHHLKHGEYWHSLNDRRKIVYICMLMDANVRENIYKGIRIYRNQFVFGKINSPRRWGYANDIENIRKDMEKFERDGIISREVISKDGRNIFSVVTILSWDVTHNYTHTMNEENE